MAWSPANGSGMRLQLPPSVVRQIVRDAKASDYAFGTIIKGIVNSDQFRRQGPDEKKHTLASTANNGTAAAQQP